MQTVLLGCGDIGRRIAAQLLESREAERLLGYVHSKSSAELCVEMGIPTKLFDLDDLQGDLSDCQNSKVYYTVAPQIKGQKDLRTKALLEAFTSNKVRPAKMVVISTTGVYGDCAGRWVDETSPLAAKSDRALRRLDSETQWQEWSKENAVPLVVLRVPGIYSNSRLPRQRLSQGTPVVFAEECGFSNRIHADDLAQVAVLAMSANTRPIDIFNVSDGRPGTIAEYLQAAAKALDLPALPEISMQEAEKTLSPNMLSYLRESRRINNKKMLDELGVRLRYPDFRQGLNF